MPSLIDVQHGFARQSLEQLRIRLGQRLAYLADDLRQVAAGNIHPHHIPEELADRGERGVADALHESHQGRQPWAEQSRLLHRLRQAGVVELLAVRAPVGQALMLRDDGRCCGDFHLLHDVGRALGKPKRTAALGAAIQRVRLETVDGFGRKRRSQVLLMSRLPATPAFLAVLAWRLGRFDHIAGGRLGRGRGVLQRGGQLLLQAGVLLAKLPVLLAETSVFLFQCRDAFHRSKQFLLQRRKTLRERFVFRTPACFPQLHATENTKSTPPEQGQHSGSRTGILANPLGGS